jgi:dextranase
LTDDDGNRAVATAAVEALDGWWQSPRHAAITDYRDPDAATQATRALVDWQVNVVQHYDWMWRHYRYRPPDGSSEFVDALGRTVSHDAVRASIEAGHRVGIASLAYGAVYGAEPEHVQQHPDDRVFDEAGEPLSLGGAFYINDIRPGAAWRTRLLAQYDDAVSGFGFDGIHMDTYGPPYVAMTAAGEAVDFARLYPGLIAEAAERLGLLEPGTRVLFNCVDGFPLDSVAPAPAAAIYLELWPPDDSFAHVVCWIDRARAVAAGRQVVIAAYAATLRDPTAVVDRAEAMEAPLLLGAVIAAAGGYHHTLAAGDRLLVEGYYPSAVAMEPHEVDEMRAAWCFGARYVHLLSDPGLVSESPAGLVIRDAGRAVVPCSTEPREGALWLRASRAADGTWVMHLVDLRAQVDSTWNTPKQKTPIASGLVLEWRGAARSLVCMSPWSASGDALPLVSTGEVFELPEFRRWLMVVGR